MIFALDTNVVSELSNAAPGYMFPISAGERDALIAATALVHGMTVATRNVADFQPTGVTLINPWDAQQCHTTRNIQFDLLRFENHIGL
jgi:predicted nucleic acid-binding protein